MERKIKNVSLVGAKSHYKIFKYIHDNPWCAKNDLGVQYSNKKYLNVVLRKACDKGLIERKRLDTDKRKFIFKLSNKGIEQLKTNNIDSLFTI